MNLLLGVALVLGLMIMIHEWGHFIAARLFGVRVDVFSIGFGPRLFGWKSGSTDYRVSIIPLGGYVRMAGQDPTEIDSPGRSWVGSRAGAQTETPGKIADAVQPAAEGAAHQLASNDTAQVTGAADELMSKPRWQRAVISAAGPAVNL